MTKYRVFIPIALLVAAAAVFACVNSPTSPRYVPPGDVTDTTHNQG